MNTGDDSGATLVAAAQQGDRQAFATLFDRYQRMVLVLCNRMLDDPGLAEDALHKAALEAMLSLDQLHHSARFGA